MNGERRPKEVITTPEFDAQRTSVEPNIKRFDEAFRGIEWSLARWHTAERVILVARLGTQGPVIEVRATVEQARVILTGIGIVPGEA